MSYRALHAHSERSEGISIRIDIPDEEAPRGHIRHRSN
nr:MAG TPA: hypothetical protein [Bacteriophage sp.]